MLIKDFTKSMIDNRGDPGTLIHIQHLCDMRIDRGFSFFNFGKPRRTRKEGQRDELRGDEEGGKYQGSPPRRDRFLLPLPFPGSSGLFC